MLNHLKRPILIDFGMANSLDLKVGTKHYYAPEQQHRLAQIAARRDKSSPPLTTSDCKKCDIWAMGLTIYRLLEGYLLLADSSDEFETTEEWLLSTFHSKKLHLPYKQATAEA